MATIRTICAWCKADMGTKDSEGAPGGVSHAMCPECQRRIVAQAERQLRARAQTEVMHPITFAMGMCPQCRRVAEIVDGPLCAKCAKEQTR